MRLAQRLGPTAGLYHHGGLFPLPQWRPSAGLTLDQALIFAIIRAESAFVPDAESHVGALGLMQVMPATARVITRFADLALPKSDLLRDPEVGMAFGQAYLEHLLQYDSIGDNLIFLAAAYNAGPGRVPRWRATFDRADDPLLFLESIPIKETRIYVKKVLTNLWTYRARLGQPQPSLEDLAHNRWPRYQSLDARPGAVCLELTRAARSGRSTSRSLRSPIRARRRTTAPARSWWSASRAMATGSPRASSSGTRPL
jgi:soluble lytic murein transglycosylase